MDNSVKIYLQKVAITVVAFLICAAPFFYTFKKFFWG